MTMNPLDRVGDSVSSTRPPRSARWRNEDGVALIIALMSMMLMLALGIALVLTTTTETSIAANFRDGGEALYAADAGVERVMQDLLTVSDWNKVLQGTIQSAFIDGAPSGTRTLGDGTAIDLAQATSMINCGKTTACGASEMNAFTDERPWSTNNPRWQLYAYGPLEDILTGSTAASINSQMYVIVWIGDDPSENDDDPTTDGNASTNPGSGVLALRAEAFGPGGAHRVIETTVARTDTTEIERGYTGQRGQDEQNRRARKAAIQTPGKSLSRQEMNISSGVLQ